MSLHAASAWYPNNCLVFFVVPIVKHHGARPWHQFDLSRLPFKALKNSRAVFFLPESKVIPDETEHLQLSSPDVADPL